MAACSVSRQGLLFLAQDSYSRGERRHILLAVRDVDPLMAG